MRPTISAVVVGLMLSLAPRIPVIAQPAASESFRLSGQTLNGGLERSASASFMISNCLAPEPEAGGTSLSASFRLHAGCGAAVAAGVTETPTATPTLTPISTATATNTATATVPQTGESSSTPGTGTPTRTPTATPIPINCIGDCNSDGTVTINELILGVDIALGFGSVEQCVAFDANGDTLVTINELIAGVSNALSGCVALAPRQHRVRERE